MMKFSSNTAFVLTLACLLTVTHAVRRKSCVSKASASGGTPQKKRRNSTPPKFFSDVENARDADNLKRVRALITEAVLAKQSYLNSLVSPILKNEEVLESVTNVLNKAFKQKKTLKLRTCMLTCIRKSLNRALKHYEVNKFSATQCANFVIAGLKKQGKASKAKPKASSPLKQAEQDIPSLMEKVVKQADVKKVLEEEDHEQRYKNKYVCTQVLKAIKKKIASLHLTLKEVAPLLAPLRGSLRKSLLRYAECRTKIDDYPDHFSDHFYVDLCVGVVMKALKRMKLK